MWAVLCEWCSWRPNSVLFESRGPGSTWNHGWPLDGGLKVKYLNSWKFTSVAQQSSRVLYLHFSSPRVSYGDVGEEEILWGHSSG